MEHTDECLAGGKCNCAVNMGWEANAGMARDDSSTATRLLDKNWSPLIVRKYQMEGWPMYIGIICDANLNDLDNVVYDIVDTLFIEKEKELELEDVDGDKAIVKVKVKVPIKGFMDGTIQGVRNTCGLLGDRLVQKYNEQKRGVAEGVIVCWYVDKCFVSSAYGDFMTHEKCAAEFYHIVNTLPHI
jgi:hypothetical protein